MSSGTRHLSVHIDRPVRDVYDYAADPAHIVDWAPGLGSTIEQVDGRWEMDSPMGRIVVVFAPRNDFGVLDHEVTTADGTTFYNPMRVLRDGTGSEIVFSVRRRVGVSDEEFDRDAEAVLADLHTLRDKVEGRVSGP